MLILTKKTYFETRHIVNFVNMTCACSSIKMSMQMLKSWLSSRLTRITKLVIQRRNEQAYLESLKENLKESIFDLCYTFKGHHIT